MIKQVSYKYFTFLSMLYVSLSLCSLVLAKKICVIDDVSLMAASLVYPLTFPISDVLTEIYGFKKTKTIIFFSFILQILFAAICAVATRIESPNNFMYSSDYIIVLGGLLRVAFGSLIAAILGTFLNMYLIEKSKIMLHGRLFALRSLFSTLVGEFLYTFIALSMMFYGAMSFDGLMALIFSSMLIKIVYNLITIIPASIAVIFLRNKNEETFNEAEYLKDTLSLLNTVKVVK